MGRNNRSVHVREHAACRRPTPPGTRPGCPAGTAGGRARRLHRGTIPRILSSETRRAYASKVRGYLAWLADATADGLIDGDPLAAALATWGPATPAERRLKHFLGLAAHLVDHVPKVLRHERRVAMAATSR